MVVVTSLGPPEEGIRHTEAHTSTYINEKALGKGTLYVSEARVSWVGDAGHKFSLEYPHVAMHAISRDTSAFPRAEHLYLMIDTRLVDSEGTPTPTSTPETSEDEEDDVDERGMTEIRFVPDEKSRLDDMFKAMSECQALHPDPEAEESAEEEEGGMFDDADEEGEGEANGAGDAEAKMDEA